MRLVSWLREVCQGRLSVHSSRSRRSAQATRSFADVQILESRRLLTNMTAAVTAAGVLVVTDPSNAATNDVTLEYHLTNGQTPSMDFFLKGAGSTTINGQADYDVTANLASFSTITVLTGNNNDTIHLDTTNQGFSSIPGGITLSGSGSFASGFVSATGNNTYDFVSTNSIGNVVVDDLTGAGNQDKLDFSTSSDVQLNLGTTSVQQVNKGNANLNLSLTSNTVLSNIIVVGGTSTSMLTTGSGNDILDASGSTVTSVLTAGSGNATLKGGSGNNTFNIGSGTDQLIGSNASTNVFVFSNNATGVTLSPSTAGTNTLDFHNVSSPLTVDLTAATAIASYGAATVSTGSGQGALFHSVIGGTGNNTLTAGAGPNVTLDASGSSGINILTAGSGADILKGGSGNNTLTAGSGVDTLTGGSGKNTFMTGSGTAQLIGTNGTVNTFVFTNTATVVTITPSYSGANTLDFHRTSSPLTVDLTAATTIASYGAATVSTNGVGLGGLFQTVYGGTGNNTLTAGSGSNVTLDASGSFGTCILTAGNSGNNVLKGGSGSNSFKFADAVGVSLDTIVPGTGANTLDFSRVTTALGNPLQVNLTTSGGVNDPTDSLWLASATRRRVYVVYASDTNSFQLVIGSSTAGGANQLTAGTGPSVTLDVSGSSGTNSLTAGSSGNEVLKGGSGANTYKFGDAVGVSLNTIVPGTGANTLDFSRVTSSPSTPLQVNLATSGGVNDPTDTLWLALQTLRRVYVANGSDTNAFQLVVGSNTVGGANQLTGGTGSNVTLDASGSSGTNTLTAGNSGKEILKGGSGANTFKFGDAVGISLDTVVPGTGTNALNFSNVTSSIGVPLQVNLATSGGVNDPTDTLWLASITNRRVYVGNGSDTNAFQLVIGSANVGGANQLTAGTGPNVTLDVSGSSGTNTLTAGSSGNETLKGGLGATTYKFGDAVSIALNTIVPGTARNTLDFSNVTTSIGAPLQVNLATIGGVNDPTDTLWLASAKNRRLYVNNGSDTNSFQRVIGSTTASGENRLTAGAGSNVTLDVSGSSGLNILAAGTGSDALIGGSGNNEFTTGSGTDQMIGTYGKNNAFVFLNSATSVIVTPSSTGANTLDFRRVTSVLTVDLKASQTIATYGNTTVTTSGAYQGSLFQTVLRPK
jgi:Ca2+-binding RTX toxin-like protein